MNIEEVRKVFWLKSNRRPVGKLLDQGQRTKERLKWAWKQPTIYWKGERYGS
jgi:hypothetical protein